MRRTAWTSAALMFSLIAGGAAIYFTPPSNNAVMKKCQDDLHVLVMKAIGNEENLAHWYIANDEKILRVKEKQLEDLCHRHDNAINDVKLATENLNDREKDLNLLLKDLEAHDDSISYGQRKLTRTEGALKAQELVAECKRLKELIEKQGAINQQNETKVKELNQLLIDFRQSIEARQTQLKALSLSAETDQAKAELLAQNEQASKVRQQLDHAANVNLALSQAAAATTAEAITQPQSSEVDAYKQEHAKEIALEQTAALLEAERKKTSELEQKLRSQTEYCKQTEAGKLNLMGQLDKMTAEKQQLAGDNSSLRTEASKAQTEAQAENNRLKNLCSELEKQKAELQNSLSKSEATVADLEEKLKAARQANDQNMIRHQESAAQQSTAMITMPVMPPAAADTNLRPIKFLNMKVCVIEKDLIRRVEERMGRSCPFWPQNDEERQWLTQLTGSNPEMDKLVCCLIVVHLLDPKDETKNKSMIGIVQTCLREQNDRQCQPLIAYYFGRFRELYNTYRINPAPRFSDKDIKAIKFDYVHRSWMLATER